MRAIILLLSAFILFSCEKEDIFSPEKEIEVTYEIIPVGDLSIEKVSYQTAGFIRINENNPILPWHRTTYTSTRCVANPVYLEAHAYDVPMKSALKFMIYFDGELVVSETFQSNKNECGGAIFYYHNCKTN